MEGWLGREEKRLRERGVTAVREDKGAWGGGKEKRQGGDTWRGWGGDLGEENGRRGKRQVGRERT